MRLKACLTLQGLEALGGFRDGLSFRFATAPSVVVLRSRGMPPLQGSMRVGPANPGFAPRALIGRPCRAVGSKTNKPVIPETPARKPIATTKNSRRYPGSTNFGLRPCRIWAPQRCTGLCRTGIPTGNNIAADPAWQIPDNAAGRFVRVKQRRPAAFPG